MIMRHFDMGKNAIGLDSTLSVDDDGQCVYRVVQSAASNRNIMDKNNAFRREYRENKDTLKKRLDQGGFMFCGSIPITVFHSWKKEWQRSYSDKYTLEDYIQLKIGSRDFDAFRAYDKDIVVPEHKNLGE